MTDLSPELVKELHDAGWEGPFTTDDLIDALPQMIDDEKTGDSGMLTLKRGTSGWSVSYEPLEREEDDIMAGHYTGGVIGEIGGIDIGSATLKDTLAEMWLYLKSKGVIK